jgi:hypothetical protein
MQLEVECRKVEANWKSLELIVVMDARDLKITIERAKHFENKNADLDSRLCS